MRDRAGTVVELLDPLVTGCCQNGLGPRLLPLPWDCWANEPLSDQTPGPQPVAVLAEHINASAICDWKSSFSLSITEQTSAHFLLHLGVDIRNRKKLMSYLNFGND